MFHDMTSWVKKQKRKFTPLHPTKYVIWILAILQSTGRLSNGDVTIWARYYLKKPKLNDTYSTSRLQNTIYINIL